MGTAAEARSEAEAVESPSAVEAELREQVRLLKQRVLKGEERRRALIHIMSDLTQLNKRLADQRKAMLHILVDYEGDRRRLARQTERLDSSRRLIAAASACAGRKAMSDMRRRPFF